MKIATDWTTNFLKNKSLSVPHNSPLTIRSELPYCGIHLKQQTAHQTFSWPSLLWSEDKLQISGSVTYFLGNHILASPLSKQNKNFNLQL